MKENQQPVLGLESDQEEEQLLANAEATARRKIQIMDQLDEIHAPIICTVVIEPKAFDYRNRAFWEQFAKKDEGTRSALVDFINSRKEDK